MPPKKRGTRASKRKPEAEAEPEVAEEMEETEEAGAEAEVINARIYKYLINERVILYLLV